jgi:hypothetical protein
MGPKHADWVMSGFSQPLAEPAQAIRPRRNIFTRAEIEALRGREEFAAAFLEAAKCAVDDYRDNRLFNRVFNDRGQWVVTWLAHYLHHFPLPGNEQAGLTVSRLRKVCQQIGVCSGGRAAALLGVMRFAGYLRPARHVEDRRLHVLVPTEKFVALRRQRLLRHFTGVSEAIPETGAVADLLDDPVFMAAFIRHSAEGYIAGFRFTEHATEIAPYFERASASMILMELFVEASRQGDGAARCSISALASHFWLSRGHVRSVLNSAAADGFIERVDSMRGPVVVRPALTDVLGRFFAVSFLYFDHCMRLALRDMRGEKDAATAH